MRLMIASMNIPPSRIMAQTGSPPTVRRKRKAQPLCKPRAQSACVMETTTPQGRKLSHQLLLDEIRNFQHFGNSGNRSVNAAKPPVPHKPEPREQQTAPPVPKHGLTASTSVPLVMKRGDEGAQAPPRKTSGLVSSIRSDRSASQGEKIVVEAFLQRRRRRNQVSLAEKPLVKKSPPLVPPRQQSKAPSTTEKKLPPVVPPYSISTNSPDVLLRSKETSIDYSYIDMSKVRYNPPRNRMSYQPDSYEEEDPDDYVLDSPCKYVSRK